MRISELMTEPVVTCPLGATLDHAARLMWERDCGIVPVIDDEGRLAGVVTDRDVCMAAYTQGQPIGAIPVTTAMARDVVALHGDDLVDHAEDLMQEHQVRRLPVVDLERRPIGIVSINDLLRLASRAKRSHVDRMIVQTLASVGRPRLAADNPVDRARADAPVPVVPRVLAG
jgi:CBS domain-containing protein